MLTVPLKCKFLSRRASLLASALKVPMVPLFEYSDVSVQYYKLVFANAIESGGIKTRSSVFMPCHTKYSQLEYRKAIVY